MCGRFAFYSPAEAAVNLFGASRAFDVDPRYNIAPTQYVVAVRDDEDGEREACSLKWGLIPFWAKDPAIGNRMINARAETVAEKPAYRAAYRHRRCIVLADGFYEWQPREGGKVPYFISLASGEPFALAGLWERWKDRNSEDRLETATLITMQANDFMASLHHRMPMILDADGVDRWLSGDEAMLEHAVDHTPVLKAWPVDRRVNNARNEGDDLLQPVGEAISG